MKSLLERISASADELRMVRVKAAVDSAASASMAQLLRNKQNILSYVSDIESLLDLGATSTTDIATNLRGFNATEWTEKLHESLNKVFEKIVIFNAKVAVHNALFPSNQIDELTESNIGGICSLMLSKKEENDNTTGN